MTVRYLSDSIATLSPDVAWDVRLMCFCGAMICLVVAADLTLKAVRALARAVYAAAFSALAAGTALGLLAAATLTTL
jgi:hypothetical protein